MKDTDSRKQETGKREQTADMEKLKTDELFKEMDEFLSEDPVMSEIGTNDPDDEGLPYETLDVFSTEPVEFGEMAERMLDRVENLFDLTAVYNRHSEKYLKSCALLEKGIKFLGSACITKIALEHEKYSFPELRQLSTMKLYRMVSFNYRKLDKALTEKLEQKNDLYPELLDMEFRYFNLLRRLRSTEAKIYNYHFKKNYIEEDFRPVIEGNAFTEKSWTKCYTQDKEEAPAFRNAPAFPLVAKPEIRDQRSEMSKDRKAGCGKENSQWPLSGDQQKSPAGIEVSDSSVDNTAPNLEGSIPHSEFRIPSTDEDISHSALRSSLPEGGSPFHEDADGMIRVDAARLRQLLLKDAHDSGEPGLMMEIAGEPPEKLYERFRKKYGGQRMKCPADQTRSGPSDELRKKLREKRKKRQ